MIEISSSLWGGSSLVSMAILDAANYVVATPPGADCTSTNEGYFVLGQDLETYTGRSSQLLSGVLTLGSDLYFQQTSEQWHLVLSLITL